jgi:hypothetical protein
MPTRAAAAIVPITLASKELGRLGWTRFRVLPPLTTEHPVTTGRLRFVKLFEHNPIRWVFRAQDRVHTRFPCRPSSHRQTRRRRAGAAVPGERDSGPPGRHSAASRPSHERRLPSKETPTPRRPGLPAANHARSAATTGSHVLGRAVKPTRALEDEQSCEEDGLKRRSGDALAQIFTRGGSLRFPAPTQFRRPSRTARDRRPTGAVRGSASRVSNASTWCLTRPARSTVDGPPLPVRCIPGLQHPKGSWIY